MWSEDGSDEIVGLHDEHVKNRYFLVTNGTKTQIYTSRWEIASKSLPEWFDKFIGIKDVIIPDPEKWHPHPLDTHYKYMLVEDWGKTFLLPIDYGCFWDGLKWFEKWFDSIEPINWEKQAQIHHHRSMSEDIKNKILLDSFWFPFMIINEWRKFVFDKYARAIKELEDWVDDLVVVDDIVYIQKWGQCFILDFVYDPMFKWKESWFDRFIKKIDYKTVIVSKGSKNYVYDMEKNTFTEIVAGETPDSIEVIEELDTTALVEKSRQLTNQNILENFFGGKWDAPDGLPF